MCPEVRPEGWVRCFAPPLGGVVYRGHVLYPAFALGFGQLGFWSLCIFCLKFALTAHAQLFLVPCSFFVFCCSRRGGSRCKHCSKGSQVPGLSQKGFWCKERALRPFIYLFNKPEGLPW